MIESVQERQRGAFDFGRYYDNLCALQDSCPVPAVKAHLHEGVLDINGDRIRAADWDPILNSVSINKNLSFVAVRSYFQLKVDERTSDRRAAVLKSRIPVVRSKEMTFRLCRTLRDCLAASESLTCVELQGLPLRERDLACLVKGLVKNDTLKHLSLEFCRVADFGVQIVCQALKQAGNVNTLNLTGCSLSYNGMEAIAELIKYQAMTRHNEAWKESLRYRRPNLDSMSGLRRITLNGNPLIDNRGAAVVAEAVKDDLWVKAIDLQQCGIGNAGAKAFLNVLKINATLTVLDLRQNPLIDRDVLRAVTEQVLVNTSGKESEYRWLRVDNKTAAEDSDGRRKLRPVSARSADTPRRPAFRPAGPARPAVVDSPRCRRVAAEEEEGGSRGQPWRTAARASRYKGYPPDHVPGRTHLEERSEASQDGRSSTSTARTEEDADSSVDDSLSPLAAELESAPPAASLKELRVQVMHLRRQAAEEARARRKAEEKMMELMLENQRLHRDLHRRDDARPAPQPAALNDEKVLRNIEQSFHQFHAFLDLLRDAGLGRVVTAAGMDSLPRVGAPEETQDPVEQSYRSAANARSEADRLYLRLKEATSRGAAERFLPSGDARQQQQEGEEGEERTWTREPPPEPTTEAPAAEDASDGIAEEALPLSAGGHGLSEDEEGVEEDVEEEAPRSAVDEALDRPADYTSDTFETSGDEGGRFGRSLGPEDLGRMKASLDSVQEIDLQDF